MQYKIKVSKVGPPDERGYTRDEEIYSQTVEDIDLLAVIRRRNNPATSTSTSLYYI